jgi:hypothetical protein
MRRSGCKVEPGASGGTPKEDLQEVMIGMAQQTEIKALQRQGFGPSAIAARLGLDRKTVRKVPHSGRFFAPAPAYTSPPTVHTRSLSCRDSAMARRRCAHVLQATPYRPTHAGASAGGVSRFRGVLLAGPAHREKSANARPAHRHPGAGLASRGVSGGLRHRRSGPGRRSTDL